MAIDVYTDGSCINNGKKNAKAGYGVWFGEDDPRNMSGLVKGKQTNNTGELTAILKALKMLEININNSDKVIIHTDSKYSLLACTTYGEKMSKKGWVDSKGKEIPNKKLIEELYNTIKKHPNVTLKHVKAHTEKSDKHSIGNMEADKLANNAIRVYKQKEDKSPVVNRVYLNVPYKRKEEAKNLGARWDPRKKKWYTEKMVEKLVELFGK